MARRARDDGRRSSMDTLFELRARRWWVRGLIAIVLASISAAVTWRLTR